LLLQAQVHPGSVLGVGSIISDMSLLTETEIRLESLLAPKYEGTDFRSDVSSAGGVLDRVRLELNRLGPSSMRGLRWLDIGCGCDLEFGDDSLPALPLLAAMKEIEVTGVDKYAYTGPGANLYRHICHDLTAPNVDFREITGESDFDVVTSINFLDEHIRTSSPALLDLLGDDRGEAREVLKRIRAAAWQVLSPGGVWIWGVEVKRK
jgi:hypothetical protein